MTSNEFFVTPRMGKWYVDHGTDCHGPYLSRRDAVADAIEAAERMFGPRKPSAVLVKLPGSNAEVVWTSRHGVREGGSGKPPHTSGAVPGRPTAA